MDNLVLELKTSHLVKSEDLNHHGTLFAGQMARWLVEAGVITAATLIGNTEDIVCVQISHMKFEKPIHNGEILEMISKVAHLGQASITVFSEVFRKKDNLSVVSNYTTFVTVDEQNKPYKHGKVLPLEYIARNREICAEAKKIRERL